MQFERASLEIVGPVAVLRMDDPDVLNALSPGMIGGMTEALDTLAAAATPARCLVLTGTGRAFSTGANLQGRADANASRGAGINSAARQPEAPTSVVTATCPRRGFALRHLTVCLEKVREF